MTHRFGKVLCGTLLTFTTAFAYGDVSTTPTRVARPAQYVMVGFDGGLNLQQWQAMRTFAADMNKNKKPVNFTYFFSAVYLLHDSNRNYYAHPKHHVGYSAIGFGDDVKGITARLGLLNDSFNDGQEIASHAAGHFDAEAEKWTESDWESEFRQFKDLLFNAYFNNGITPANKFPQGYAFAEKDIVGFRAPALGVTPGMWPNLKSFGYKYDVSVPGEMTDWPVKNALGTWQVGVPIIEVAGTGKKIVGMDYNFYVAQTKGKEDPANRETYRKQMYDSYMNFFNSSYYGRRAPVSLGHHFALYNDGAYWLALQDFLKSVCGLPEVKCVSYKNYVSWLDSLTPENLKAYRLGQFEPLPRPRRPSYTPERPLDLNLSLQKSGAKIDVLASGNDLAAGMKTLVKINGKAFSGQSLSLENLRREFPKGSELEISATVVDSRGNELQRATHRVENLGTSEESYQEKPDEARLLLGDLPEAHEHVQ